MSRRPPPRSEPAWGTPDADDAADFDDGPSPPSAPRGRPGNDCRPPRRSGSSFVPWFLVALLLVAIALVGVLVLHPMQTQLFEARRSATDAAGTVAALQEQVNSLESGKKQAETERDALAAQVEHKEQDSAAVQAAQEELAHKLAQEVDKGNVLIRQTEGELAEYLVDQVLFDSERPPSTPKAKTCCVGWPRRS